MEQVLSNPLIQAALVALLLVALNAAKVWLQTRFPTQAKLIDENWCYLGPLVKRAIVDTQAELAKGGVAGSAAARIIEKTTDAFAAEYRTLERKEPTSAELSAARAEIAVAVEKVIGG